MHMDSANFNKYVERCLLAVLDTESTKPRATQTEMSAVASSGSGGDRKGGNAKGRRTGSDFDSSSRGPGKDGGKRQVFGKPGKFRCMLGNDFRDHMAAKCLRNLCTKCGEKGQWVRECTAIICGRCGEGGYVLNGCPVRKRKAAEFPTSQQPRAKNELRKCSLG